MKSIAKSVFVALFAGCASAPSPSSSSAAFPAPWFGVFRGDLVAWRDGSSRRLTTMELRIGPEVEPGRVRFQIVYGDGDAAQLRDYALVAVDAAAGRWKVDEGGGVEMAATVAGDELCCTFAVEGQILTTRYRRVGDVVLFELESFARDAATESAGGVASWRDLAIQRATLRRQR